MIRITESCYFLMLTRLYKESSFNLTSYISFRDFKKDLAKIKKTTENHLLQRMIFCHAVFIVMNKNSLIDDEVSRLVKLITGKTKKLDYSNFSKTYFKVMKDFFQMILIYFLLLIE